MRGALLLTILGAAACGGSAVDSSRPHVVFVVVDTLRGDLTYDPQGLVDAPHLDQLAAEAKVYEAAIAHAPMTLPSHTAMFTGLLPHQSGVMNNGVQVPEALPLLPDWLRRYGYETRAVVSLGTLNPIDGGPGLTRGFDEFDRDYLRIDDASKAFERMRLAIEDRNTSRPLFLFAHFADPHAPYREHGPLEVQVELHGNGELLGSVDATEAHEAERVLRLEPGRYQLELKSDGSFLVRDVFLRPRYSHVRLPIEFTESERLERTSRAVAFWDVPERGEYILNAWVSDFAPREEVPQRYMREIEHVDRFIGQLVETLQAEGMWDNCILVFTSDHGEALGEHGHIGHVQGLTDEQVRVPLMIRLPQAHPLRDELMAWPSGRPVGHVDLAPTLVALCGLPEMPPGAGRSLLEASEASSVPVLSETYKPESKRNLLSLRDEDFKLIWDADADTWEMYDLQEDPFERTNVHAERAAERPDWPARLRSAFEQAQGRLRGDAVGATADMLKALGY